MIRKARIDDARAIHHLLVNYARDGLVLPRSLAEIYEGIREFFIFEEQGQTLGTASLNISWDNLAEVRSLAVDPEFKGRGIGQALVEACLEEASALGIPRVFALTYQTDFFARMGFSLIEKSELPHKIWGDCMRCPKFPDCDEDAVAIEVTEAGKR